MTEDLPIDKCNEFMKMRLSASHTIVSQTFRSLGCNHLELKNPNLIEYVNLTRNWLQHTHTAATRHDTKKKPCFKIIDKRNILARGLLLSYIYLNPF